MKEGRSDGAAEKGSLSRSTQPEVGVVALRRGLEGVLAFLLKVE